MQKHLCRENRTLADGSDMLKPRKRITKKELKEDKLLTSYVKANRWLGQHRKYLTIGLALLLIVGLAAIFSSRAQKAAEQNASEIFLRATSEFQQGDFHAAAQKFENVIDEYGGTSYGILSQLYLANCYVKNGRTDDAFDLFSAFLRKYKGDVNLQAAAMASKAAILEEKSNFAEAAELYEKISKDYPTCLMCPNYLISAAQNFAKIDKKDKAQQLFDRVVKEFPESQEKNDAILLKKMLGS